MTERLLLAIGVVFSAVCGHVSGPPAGPGAVVLITLDTTRADRLSPYGFLDVAMPALDRLAHEGVIFDQAMTVAPLTLPAHVSLFTGLLPPAHGVRDNVSSPLAPHVLTLAEILGEHGFRTAAFVGSDVLHRDRGLSQGFDRYGGVVSHATPATRGQRRAEEVVEDATRWLDDVGESPFFLWAHLYDAHRPYDPPEPFASRHASDPYVGEIAYADAQIGRLVQALERRQRLDRTIVIVAGDHGESLGEHGERDHGILIYENVVRVPLIVRIPGAAPGRIHSVVRLIDVMPTVLELLRLPIPRIDGVSLMELMSGGGEEREAYSESEYPRRLGWSPLRALRDGRFKVIDAPRPELYDLQDDPYEERNLYHERRRTAEALMRRLRVVAAGSSGSPSQAAPSEMVSDEVRDRLAALGYVTTTPSPHPHPGALIDPKDALAKGEHPWDRR